MSRKNNLGLTAILTDGAILPPSVLQRIHQEDKSLGGLEPVDYGYSGNKLREAASRAWEALRGSWQVFKLEQKRLTTGASSYPASLKWLNQVFREIGYGSLTAKYVVQANDTEYSISHSYKNVPIHIVGWEIDLDKRTPGVKGAAALPPHGLVQLALNGSDKHLWGFVTNGLRFRILRDSKSLSRISLVEFDLEAIFDGELYDEFLLFFLVCHASRVQADIPSEFWLEKWSNAAVEDGKRALKSLRNGVQYAIEALGHGFVSNPANVTLRTQLQDGTLDKQDYYRQLLRLVYQLLFLFVAEDRNLLHVPETADDIRKLYAEAYSTQRIRRIAEKQRGSRRHSDYYEQVRLVISFLSRKNGCKELGLPGLGGFLYSPDTYPALQGARLTNATFIEAIRHLAVTEEDGRRTRIDYKNLGSEELGSIYESLLEQHPELTADGREYKFTLNIASGNDRKTSGSYYTPDSLIQCLLDSALEPVVDDRLQKAGKDKKLQEQAILEMTVVDPAVGSGHFLIAAAHRLAKRLAMVRSGEEEPTPSVVRTALRDVIGNCLYGIDINPMSAELCKVSLWMEALEPGKPLSFLDHHIQVGNSLLGATPELLRDLIPDAAFTAKEGDDKARCTSLRNTNKSERTGQGNIFNGFSTSVRELQEHWYILDKIQDNTLDGLIDKERKYKELEIHMQEARLLADTWCAAFTVPKLTGGPSITTSSLGRVLQDPKCNDADVARKEAARFKFFHPHIAFPTVFAKGGFHVVLGNPPWERVKLQEVEWFAKRDTAVAKAENANARKNLIKKLIGRPIYEEFLQAKADAEAISQFLRTSGRFPLCGRGDVNLYTVFAENNRSYANGVGRAGYIVPTGICTDDTTKVFFADIMEKRSLVSLYDFENGMRDADDIESDADSDDDEEVEVKPKKKKGSTSSEERIIFEGVHASFKFCLLTLNGTDRNTLEPRFAFFCHRPADIDVPGKAFTLTLEEISLLNPNTKTCPVFRSGRDAEVTKDIYRRVPVLIREKTDTETEKNPWGVKFNRMFDMSNDSNLFRTAEQFEEIGATLRGNHWFVATDARSNNQDIHAGEWLPLYEAKMMHQFDHRWATYEPLKAPTGKKKVGVLASRDVTLEEKQDPNFCVMPHYWVHDLEVQGRLSTDNRLLLGWRDITNVTNERTMLMSLLPIAGVGHNMPIMYANGHWTNLMLLQALMNSYSFDFIARQKIGGSHMTYLYLKQLPALIPSSFETVHGVSLHQRWLLERTMELCNTSIDIEISNSSPKWNQSRRFQIRAELDAAMFHLYGIKREDVAYIMETFPIVKRRDIQQYGTYKTKETILAIYDDMAECIESGTSYQSPLDPPPGHGIELPELPPLVDYVVPAVVTGAKKPTPKPKASNPAQTGMSFRSVADTPKPKLASPTVQVSVPEPKPIPTPPPPPKTEWPVDVALRPIKTNEDGSVLYVKVKGSDGSVVVPKATLHWSKQSGDTKLFYVRPVDGSGDRKILSPPAVVVRWKG